MDDPAPPLTLQAVADDPSLLTLTVESDSIGPLTLRPLVADDAEALDAFLQGLSHETRHLILPPGVELPSGASLCDAIGGADKLRLVLESNNRAIVGLIEFAFDIPAPDVARFAAYGVELDASTDCRWGSTLADAFQGIGLGTLVFPIVVDIARQFGNRRIILWDGVVSTNARAIHYYENHGFQPLGSYMDGDDEMLDMMLTL